MVGCRKLIIAGGGETLFIYGKKIELPPLGLANTLINQRGVSEAEGALKKWQDGFFEEINFPAPDSFEEPPVSFKMLLGEGLPKSFLFALELRLVKFALSYWLVPCASGGKTPSQRLFSAWEDKTQRETAMLMAGAILGKLKLFDQLHLLLWELVGERNSQGSVEVIDQDVEQVTIRSNDFYRHIKEKSVPTKAYSAQGFLPLLWAEIRYFAENDIFARPCEVCGRLFPVKNQRGQKYCSPECRSEAKRVESRQRYEDRKNQMRGG